MVLEAAVRHITEGLRSSQLPSGKGNVLGKVWESRLVVREMTRRSHPYTSRNQAAAVARCQQVHLCVGTIPGML